MRTCVKAQALFISSCGLKSRTRSSPSCTKHTRQLIDTVCQQLWAAL